MENTFCSINYINGSGGMNLSALVSMFYRITITMKEPGPTGNAHLAVGPRIWNWSRHRTKIWPGFPVEDKVRRHWQQEIIPINKYDPLIAPTHCVFKFDDFFQRHPDGTVIVITIANASEELETEAVFLEKFPETRMTPKGPRTAIRLINDYRSGEFESEFIFNQDLDFWRPEAFYDIQEIQKKYDNRIMFLPYHTLTRQPERTIDMLSEFLQQSIPECALPHHKLWCDTHQTIVKRLGLEW